MLQNHGHEAATGDEYVSKETVSFRTRTFYLIADQLFEGGYDITEIEEIQQDHLRYLAERWVNEGLAASTIQNRWSLLKNAIEKWCGREGTVNKLKSYLSDPTKAQRSMPNRNIPTLGLLDDETVLKLVFFKDRRVGNQLSMMRFFGLSRREAALFKPRVHDQGKYILITEGTRGGNQRLIEVTTPRQRDLLDELRSQSPNMLSPLCNPRRSLKQNLDRMDNVLRSIGITRAKLGLTSNDLRNRYEFDELNSQPMSPVPDNC